MLAYRHRRGPAEPAVDPRDPEEVGGHTRRVAVRGDRTTPREDRDGREVARKRQ